VPDQIKETSQRNPNEQETSDNMLTINLQQIDQQIHKQGRDLQELLQPFKQANTEPMPSFILQMPKHKPEGPSKASATSNK
jgi:hypothetical protein